MRISRSQLRSLVEALALGPKGLVDAFLDAVEGSGTIGDMNRMWMEAGASVDDIDELVRLVRMHRAPSRVSAGRHEREIGSPSVPLDDETLDDVRDLADRVASGHGVLEAKKPKALAHGRYEIGAPDWDDDALFGMDQLEAWVPEAYNALPEAYRADPRALQFYEDVNGHLIAVHWQGMESLWDESLGEWLSI